MVYGLQHGAIFTCLSTYLGIRLGNNINWHDNPNIVVHRNP